MQLDQAETVAYCFASNQNWLVASLSSMPHIANVQCHGSPHVTYPTGAAQPTHALPGQTTIDTEINLLNIINFGCFLWHRAPTTRGVLPVVFALVEVLGKLTGTLVVTNHDDMAQKYSLNMSKVLPKVLQNIC